MKKIFIFFILMELIAFTNPSIYFNSTSYAAYDSEKIEAKNEIMKAQKDSLNITDFVKEAEKYTKESLPRN